MDERETRPEDEDTEGNMPTRRTLSPEGAEDAEGQAKKKRLTADEAEDDAEGHAKRRS